MIMDEINALMKRVENVTSQLGKPLSHDGYYIEDMGCPHKIPKKLPQGYGAIYIFIYGAEESHEYLKIGMVHRNSNARYTTQHYGFSANSTLAKSICEDDEFINLEVTTDNVKDWMLENLRRINILIK